MDLTCLRIGSLDLPTKAALVSAGRNAFCSVASPLIHCNFCSTTDLSYCLITYVSKVIADHEVLAEVLGELGVPENERYGDAHLAILHV